MIEAAACPICEKHEGRGSLVGEKLYEDEHVVAFHAPVDTVNGYLGYLFVETRRHVRGLADRTDEEACAEARLVTRLARALEAAGAEHVYAFVFDHVPHHHMHVVARHPGAPKEFWGTRVDDWEDAPRGDDAAVAAFCARLRTALG
jgi:diadenosine tetraphosphate (Ap4A) HIT family hydrolase